MLEVYIKMEKRTALIFSHVSTDFLLGFLTSRKQKPAEKAVKSDIFTNFLFPSLKK